MYDLFLFRKWGLGCLVIVLEGSWDISYKWGYKSPSRCCKCYLPMNLQVGGEVLHAFGITEILGQCSCPTLSTTFESEALSYRVIGFRF